MRQQSNYIEKYLQTIRTMDISDGIYEKYGCQFTFHLPNIGLSVVKASKKKSYRTIISQPFFTHGYGYKMAAVAAPYGDGPALREYFSIFVSLLKSEHDAILEWPFRCPVTFTLLTDKKTAIISQTYNPDEHPEASESFQRPIGLRNGAFGIQNFCPLEKIDSCSLSNDFFIQIKIHLKKNLIYQAKEIDSSQCQNQQPFETDFEQKSEEI